MARQPHSSSAIGTGAGGRTTAQFRDGRGRVLIRRLDFAGVWGALRALWRVRSYLEPTERMANSGHGGNGATMGQHRLDNAPHRLAMGSGTTGTIAGRHTSTLLLGDRCVLPKLRYRKR